MPVPPSQPAKPRKKPVQERSRHLVELILDAAARILESSGFERFSTNTIAALAGVSPGSLYQYFPNHDAVLRSLVIRHLEETLLAARAAAYNAERGAALGEVIDAALGLAQSRPILTARLAQAEPLALLDDHDLALAAEVREVIAFALTKDCACIPAASAEMAHDVMAIMKGFILCGSTGGSLSSSDIRVKVKRACSGYIREQ